MFAKMLRSVSWLVAFALMFTLAACASSEAGDEQTETTTVSTATQSSVTTATQPSVTTSAQTSAETTTVEVEENPFEEFYEISWIFGFCDTYEEGAYDELMIEERYNIDLKCWNISYYDTEGLTMMLAAGDIPDFSNLARGGKTPKQLYEEGYTRSVPLDMYKTYFPHYYQLMLDNAPSSFEYNNIRGTEEYYGISWVRSNYKMFYNAPLFRLDWLENVGYEIPYEELIPIELTHEKLKKYSGQTYITTYLFEHEELNDIFRAFTEDDPDGNGEDDTYAAVIWPHTWRNVWVDLYWGQFGLVSSDATYLYHDELTGDVVPWYAYSGYKEYIAWASDMYHKGYMRTLDSGNWYDVLLATWMTGKIGYFNADRQYIARPDAPDYSDRQPPQGLWLQGEEDATFVMMPALKGPGERWGNKRYVLDAFIDGAGGTTVVGEQVSDGKLIRMLTIYNDYYMNRDDPWIREVYQGIEGVHYTWSGEPWNSSRFYKPAEEVPAQYRRGGSSIGVGAFDPQPNLYTHEAYRQIWLFHIEDRWVEKYAINPYKQINILDMGEELYEAYQDAWTNVAGQINPIINDFANRAWNGEIANIDMEWEQYLNQLYANGLEDLINDYFENDDFRTYTPPEVYD
jgi:putative aldouronate transport system substrate-binding protein